MQSNTKLCAEQKEILREMKMEAVQMSIEIVDNGMTTIAYKNCGNIVKFSTSVTSPNEKKFRRKVGQFQALERLMWNDNYAILQTEDFYRMMYDVLYIPME